MANNQEHVIVGSRRMKRKATKRYGNNIIAACVIVAVGFLGILLLRTTHGVTVPKGSAEFTVASWNVLKTNGASNVKKGVEALTKYSSIIGFQELHGASAGGARQVVYDNFACPTCAYDSNLIMSSQADGSHAAGTGIIWKRSAFTALDKGYEKISEGKTTSTHYKISPKWLSWVKLRENTTGRVFYVFNTHLVAGGITKDATKDKKEIDRYNNAVNHIAFLVDKISTLKQSEDATIIMTGDFNVNYRKDVKKKVSKLPYASFKNIGVVSNWNVLGLKNIPSKKGSHKGSNIIIDYIWITKRSDLIPIASKITNRLFGSDHYPVVLRLALAPQGSVTGATSTNSETSLPSGDVIEPGNATNPSSLPDPDIDM